MEGRWIRVFIKEDGVVSVRFWQVTGTAVQASVSKPYYATGSSTYGPSSILPIQNGIAIFPLPAQGAFTGVTVQAVRATAVHTGVGIAVVDIFITIVPFPPSLAVAHVAVCLVYTAAVYTRIGFAVVDVDLAIVPFPPGFAVTGVAVFLIDAAAVYARVGFAVVDGDLAMVPFPPGFTVTAVAIFLFCAAAMHTRVGIAVVAFFADVSVPFPARIAGACYRLSLVITGCICIARLVGAGRDPVGIGGRVGDGRRVGNGLRDGNGIRVTVIYTNRFTLPEQAMFIWGQAVGPIFPYVVYTFLNGVRLATCRALGTCRVALRIPS
jgi:hypothetical protein